MKKTENFHAPSEQTLKVFHMDLGEGLDEQYYGHDGAIHLTYPNFATEMDKACLLTYDKLGIPINGNVSENFIISYYLNNICIACKW